MSCYLIKNNELLLKYVLLHNIKLIMKNLIQITMLLEYDVSV